MENNVIMYKYTLFIYSKGNSNTNNTLKNDSLFWGCSVCENVQNSFRNKTRSLRWPSSVSSSISWANRLGKNFSSSWNGNWTNITPNWSVKCCLQSLLIHFKVTTHNTWILFSVRLYIMRIILRNYIILFTYYEATNFYLLNHYLNCIHKIYLHKSNFSTKLNNISKTKKNNCYIHIKIVLCTFL